MNLNYDQLIKKCGPKGINYREIVSTANGLTERPLQDPLGSQPLHRPIPHQPHWHRRRWGGWLCMLINFHTACWLSTVHSVLIGMDRWVLHQPPGKVRNGPTKLLFGTRERTSINYYVFRDCVVPCRNLVQRLWFVGKSSSGAHLKPKSP